METGKRRITEVGIGTLIIGLIVGIGVGVWGIKTSHATNAPATTTASGSASVGANSNSTNSNSTSNQNSVDQSKDEDPLLIDKNWNPFTEMERMQQKIDRAIQNATEDFAFAPGTNMFKPDVGYSSSFDLRDRNDHYELHAYLPDVNPSDVNVKIDNDQTLHVSVKQQKQETKNTKNGSARITELGQYEQVVTLPEPVRSQDMKVSRKGHEIVVTIPKANATNAPTT